MLKAKCHSCHTSPQQGGFVFPLLTFEDTRVVTNDGIVRADKIKTVVEAGRMPPPPAALTAEEKQVVLDWLGVCGQPEPEGQGCECTTPEACP
ncbi:hypothetical protein [Sorangium sp. So ce131]|uniref:c-type cytochrome n=1 Tax=Sorangium sp. So ce131 TaxID=3133282 RepID=UPI003F5E68B7